jgi:putative membrane protein
MTLRNFLKSIIRFIIVWFVNALTILFTMWIIPGFSYVETQDVTPLIMATSAAFILGIVNLVIRHIFLLLVVPLGGLFVFILGLLANAVALMITANLILSFQIDTWGWAFLGSLIFSANNILLNNLLTIEDENSLFQRLIERLAKHRIYNLDDSPGRGLVMLEIDCLSYHHIKKALAEGWMPNIKQMIDDEGYSISRVDCGLPIAAGTLRIN